MCGMKITIWSSCKHRINRIQGLKFLTWLHSEHAHFDSYALLLPGTHIVTTHKCTFIRFVFWRISTGLCTDLKHDCIQVDSNYWSCTRLFQTTVTTCCLWDIINKFYSEMTILIKGHSSCGIWRMRGCEKKWCHCWATVVMTARQRMLSALSPAASLTDFKSIWPWNALNSGDNHGEQRHHFSQWSHKFIFESISQTETERFVS